MAPSLGWPWISMQQGGQPQPLELIWQDSSGRGEARFSKKPGGARTTEQMRPQSRSWAHHFQPGCPQ